MAIEVGRRIRVGAEEWLVDFHVASGGFAEVFHLERLKPAGGEAAIKVLNTVRKSDPVWVKKFEREARITANNPAHPNVVRSLSFWRLKEGELALVQEFVSSAKKLSVHFHDPDADRVGLVLQALYALRSVHGSDNGSGIVHRDVTAQNILVNTSTGTRDS
jgi:serine/threonine protein kinase